MDFDRIATIISLLIAMSSLVYVIKNNRRTDIKEVQERAVENAKVNMKLDEISRTLADIKYDNSSLKKELASLAERVTSVESSTKSAHKRIDDLQNRKKD